MEGERKGRRSQTLEGIGEGEVGESFPVFWDGDGGRPGGRMIPCGDRKEVDGWGGGAGVVCLPWTDIRRQKERVGWVQ